MNKIKTSILFLSIATIGCMASKQSHTTLSPTITYIKNNMRYDSIEKHSIPSQVLLDSAIFKPHSIFDSLIGLDTIIIRNILGTPDHRVGDDCFGYNFGKCPKKDDCHTVFFNITYTKKGICQRVEFVSLLMPIVEPNKGIHERK